MLEGTENLHDPVWRLCNLYVVKDPTGAVVPFRPKPEQMEIIEAVHVRGERNVLIPKARQLGLSTVICLIILDMILFEEGTQAAIVDLTQVDATKKLKGKIVFAFDRLHPDLRARFEVLKSNDHVFSVKVRGVADDTASEVQAGMNARGDTFQILLISEWGKIAFSDPVRSEEILTGALPAAKRGIKFIETTWKGGKGGHLWDITKRAMETPPEHMTAADFHLYFFPWWGDADYVLEGDASQISPDCVKYLDETEQRISKERGIEYRMSPDRRLWYFKEAWSKRLFRFQEFPSFLDECFRAPIEGAIYAEMLDKLRAEGSIKAFPVSGEALVHTFWDEGAPANTVAWYVQFVGGEIRLIDCDKDLLLTPVERVAHMKAKPFANLLGNHYLTHASEQTEKSGRTFKGQLEDAGLTNVRVVPRTIDIWVGINGCLQMMPRMVFRTPMCEQGIAALEAYHMRTESATGLAKNEPVHDWSSHSADALRTMAEAIDRGMVEGGGTVARAARSRSRVAQVLHGIADTGFSGERRARVIV